MILSPALRHIVANLVIASALLAVPAAAQQHQRRTVESYPDHIVEKLIQRQQEARQLPEAFQGIAPQLVLVKPARRWVPGDTVTVAFASGSADLHRRVKQVAEIWEQHANIDFDFGYDAGTDTYRSYSSADETYTADIRIAFDGDTYWSVVGNDSINPDIVAAWSASMNLGNIADFNTDDFRATVLHEFGHALGAEHEHQHPTAKCAKDWRWDDDAGYVSTTDEGGALAADWYGRWPGIYTYMSGSPDYWTREKVDYNLRQLADKSAYDFGPFDTHSIMKYWFPAEFFYGADTSNCYTQWPATNLSDQDRIQIAAMYPNDPALIADIKRKRNHMAQTLSILRENYSNVPALNRSIELLSK